MPETPGLGTPRYKFWFPMVSVIEEFHCIASYIHPFTFWFSRVYSLAQDLKTHGGSGSRKSQAWAWNEPQNYIHSYGFRTMLLQRKREFSFQQPIFYLRFRWVNVYYMHGRFNKKIGLRIQNTLQQSEVVSRSQTLTHEKRERVWPSAITGLD